MDRIWAVVFAGGAAARWNISLQAVMEDNVGVRGILGVVMGTGSAVEVVCCRGMRRSSRGRLRRRCGMERIWFTRFLRNSLVCEKGDRLASSYKQPKILIEIHITYARRVELQSFSYG
jgi:hypothetical protein